MANDDTLTYESIVAAVGVLRAAGKPDDAEYVIEVDDLTQAIVNVCNKEGIGGLSALDVIQVANLARRRLRQIGESRTSPSTTLIPCEVSVDFEGRVLLDRANNVLGKDGSVDVSALDDIVRHLLGLEGAYDDLDCGDEPITGTISGGGLVFEFDVEPSLIFDCVVRDGR